MTTNTIFFNQVFDKKRLKILISWVFKEFGEKEALRVVEELKTIGFHNATRAGLSIGLNDLTTPIQKSSLLSKAEFEMSVCDQDFNGGRITATERNQRIVDTWHRVSETLRKQVVEHFSTYDQLNPVYIMALSGARGNFSQVRQLVGMRGLMADPQGQIISFPIRSNLREGLTLTEYFISCSGARKGLVDTALRTADTGYLTRRLVDVSHHIVIKKICCNTEKGIYVRSLKSENKLLLSLSDRLVGRVLAQNVEYSSNSDFTLDPTRGSSMPKGIDQFALAKPLWGQRSQEGETLLKPDPTRGSDFASEQSSDPRRGYQRSQRVPDPTRGSDFAFAKPVAKQSQLDKSNLLQKSALLNNTLLAQKNQEIDPILASKIQTVKEQVMIRSPLTCGLTHSVCQLCYGWSLSQGRLVSLGEAVGVIAAQSIGEPGTQLTMRTFHTGGVFSGDLLQEIRAPYSGKIEFSKAFQGLMIRTTDGRIAFLTKTSGEIILKSNASNISSNDKAELYNHRKEENKETPDGLRPSEQNSQRSLTPEVGQTLHSDPLRGYQSKRLPAESKDPDSEAGRLCKAKLSEKRLQFQALSLLFVRQGESVTKNQLLAQISILGEEGNQPIKSRQTIFAELSGKVFETQGAINSKKFVKNINKINKNIETTVFKYELVNTLKRRTLNSIQPEKSAKLGFFHILATQIAATFDANALDTTVISNNMNTLYEPTMALPEQSQLVSSKTKPAVNIKSVISGKSLSSWEYPENSFYSAKGQSKSKEFAVARVEKINSSYFSDKKPLNQRSLKNNFWHTPEGVRVKGFLNSDGSQLGRKQFGKTSSVRNYSKENENFNFNILTAGLARKLGFSKTWTDTSIFHLPLLRSQAVTKFNSPSLYKYFPMETGVLKNARKIQSSWLTNSRLSLDKGNQQNSQTLRSKACYNPYTAQFFSSTHNKNVIIALLRREPSKAKKVNLLQSTSCDTFVDFEKSEFYNQKQQNSNFFFLRTIAQEGDLVDSDYKKYLS